MARKRRVILRMDALEDFTYHAIDNPNDPFDWSLINREHRIVEFIRPTLRRSIVDGVVMEDHCVGLDRIFTSTESTLLHGVPSLLTSRGTWF